MVLVPKQHNANDLMPQSVKTIDFSSCPLYHVKEVLVFFFFTFSLLLYWGIVVYGKLNMDNFNIHWNALPVFFVASFH